MNVVILGKKGSFHQEAAYTYFTENINTVSSNSFLELADQLEHNKEVSYGVLAIENSIAGTILQNYRILRERHFKIIGEIYLPIHHNLIGLKNTDINHITEVISHPMAIYQCRDFFKKHKNIKFTESQDTVTAVQKISQFSDPLKVAIGSQLAAEIYNLEILESNISSEENNFTRFFIITKTDDETIITSPNKASIYLRTEHQKGSLLNVLKPISQNDINLSKLQSYPVPGKLNKYYFHLDLEFENIDQFNITYNALKDVTQELKILGIYKRGL